MVSVSSGNVFSACGAVGRGSVGLRWIRLNRRSLCGRGFVSFQRFVQLLKLLGVVSVGSFFQLVDRLAWFRWHPVVSFERLEHM